MIAVAVLLGALALIGLAGMALAGFEAAWAVLLVGAVLLSLFLYGSLSRDGGGPSR